jgi:hypothetical protein
MIDELFRFISVRPPHAAAPDKVVKGSEVLSASRLAGDLMKAREAERRLLVARAYRDSALFIDDPNRLKSAILRVEAAISKLKDGKAIGLANVVAESAGGTPGEIARSQAFLGDRRQLLESMLVMRLLGDASTDYYKRLSRLIATARLIEVAATLTDPIEGRSAKAFLRSVSVELPKLPSNTSLADKAERAQGAKRVKPSTHTATVSAPSESTLKELKDAHTRLVALQKKLPLFEDRDEPFSDGSPDDDVDMLEVRAGRRVSLKKDFDSRRASVENVREGFRGINKTAKAVLAATGLGLDEDTLPEAIAEIEAAITSENAIAAASGAANTKTRYAFYQGHTIAFSPGAPIVPKEPDTPAGLIPQINPPALDVPEGVGYARILGIGDLLLVREEPRKYELGEIAHIENVMRSERRTRSHRRTHKSEEFFSTVTERETEAEQDLASTERFQLSQEASEVIRFDASLEAGFNLSASYGPTVSVGVSTSASVATGSETSKKSSSEFSREVTERAKNRVVEKVREERSRKITEEIEEINEHGFDNTKGTDHVIGIYRWVDKITRARLVNYGRRLLLEFMVPEPAALFMKALIDSTPKGITAEEPDGKIMDLTAADIEDQIGNPNDYRALAGLYQVTDLEPPPIKYIKQAESVTYEQASPSQSYSTSKKIAINPEYAADKVVFVRSRAKSGDGITLHVAASSRAGKIEDYKREFSLSNYVGELPVSISYFGNYAVSVQVTVYCKRTKQSMEKWQIKTYKALLEGYFKMKSKFDEQLAAASIQRDSQVQTSLPARNRAIEREELKRNVIAMLTGQQFDLFGAIVDGPIPEVDFAQAISEGKYIQFFENAFEWANMSYVMYPYFWSRKETWVEKIGRDNPDRDHLAFLQAGAARVTVPVRNEYRSVLVHYLDTGEIWDGEDEPDLSGVSAPYVDIAAEIREEQGGLATEPTLVDQWDVRLPTSLVALQKDAEMPNLVEDE